MVSMHFATARLARLGCLSFFLKWMLIAALVDGSTRAASPDYLTWPCRCWAQTQRPVAALRGFWWKHVNLIHVSTRSAWISSGWGRRPWWRLRRAAPLRSLSFVALLGFGEDDAGGEDFEDGDIRFGQSLRKISVLSGEIFPKNTSEQNTF